MQGCCSSRKHGEGGNFSEIVAVDYDQETIILGHDGPFHIAVSDENPVLRGMGMYWIKRQWCFC